MLATDHNTHLPQFVSPIMEPRALLIDALSQDFPPFPLLSKVIQKLRTTEDGEVILIAYLPGGHHNHGFHIYFVFVWTTLSSFRTARTYCHNRGLSWMASGTIYMLGGSYATLPNSRIFEEVSRLVAAPRRPSIYSVYRWLRFAHWAAGQGIDQLGPIAAQIATFLYYLFDNQGLSPKSIKGYRSCLASVLSHTGMAAAVQAKMMSDMITSMELQRPRMTLVLLQ